MRECKRWMSVCGLFCCTFFGWSIPPPLWVALARSTCVLRPSSVCHPPPSAIMCPTCHRILPHLCYQNVTHLRPTACESLCLSAFPNGCCDSRGIQTQSRCPFYVLSLGFVSFFWRFPFTLDSDSLWNRLFCAKNMHFLPTFYLFRHVKIVSVHSIYHWLVAHCANDCTPFCVLILILIM